MPFEARYFRTLPVKTKVGGYGLLVVTNRKNVFPFGGAIAATTNNPLVVSGALTVFQFELVRLKLCCSA